MDWDCVVETTFYKTVDAAEENSVNVNIVVLMQFIIYRNKIQHVNSSMAIVSLDIPKIERIVFVVV